MKNMKTADCFSYVKKQIFPFTGQNKNSNAHPAYNLRTLAAEKRHFKKQKYLTEKEIALGELLQNEEDNPFLKAWGRPGRENIRLLNQWTDWNFNPWFKKTGSSLENTEGMENQKKNVLNQLQEDILLREPRRIKSLELDQDDSLMILACANPRREVEAVASLIWDWIRDRKSVV